MGRGAWMIPLLGPWALQLVENQLAMLVEYAQRRFERMEHRLSNLQGVADIQRVLEDYVLASDVGLHFGNVTVGLGIAIQQVNPRLHGGRIENGDSCAARARPQRDLRITEAQLLDICDDVETVRTILAPIDHTPICAVVPRDAV